MSPPVKLYAYAVAPSCRRVRMYLAGKGVGMWSLRADFNRMMNVGGCFQHSSGIFADRMKTFPDFGKECGNRAVRFFEVPDRHLSENQYLV